MNMQEKKGLYHFQEECSCQASTQKMELSSLPPLLYYLHLNQNSTKIHQFVQCTPKKCFSSFVQPVVNARRQGKENPYSSGVSETMKFLANSPFCYQITEKTHIAIDNKLFKRPNFITDQLYAVEFVKSEFEHREPIFVGFLFLQNAKFRMLEL